MENNFKNIEEYIDKSKVRYNEPMSKHTTLKVGGNAEIFVMPETIRDIQNVLKYAKNRGINVTVIGNGSKLLVLDGGIDGIVLKLGNKFASYEIDNETISVTAGMSVPYIAIVAKNNSLTGLEFAAGIPGNIGGAIYMNAGAYGSEMSNVVSEVTYLDENLEIKTISTKECNFNYRTSIFKENKKNWIILSVKFKLKKGNKEEIAQTMKKNNESRSEKQPLEYPNAGSTFKRPEGYFVGKLIDDVNLKGYQIGGAQISEKHSGFIVNRGNATAKDVVDLITYIKEKVLEAYGVKLEEEIIILGKGE